jgi:hypothetical protein
MEKKKTLRTQFEEMVAHFEEIGDVEKVQFCKERIAALDKKSSNRGTTAKAKENKELLAKVIAHLTDTAFVGTLTELGESLLADGVTETRLSTQKLSSLLKDSAEVTSNKVKGKNLYHAVGVEVPTENKEE